MSDRGVPAPPTAGPSTTVRSVPPGPVPPAPAGTPGRVRLMLGTDPDAVLRYAGPVRLAARIVAGVGALGLVAVAGHVLGTGRRLLRR